jgi:hypothetical protein
MENNVNNKKVDFFGHMAADFCEKNTLIHGLYSMYITILDMLWKPITLNLLADLSNVAP